MKLNLGSGSDYREGWVNLDKYDDSPHHKGETEYDILADAHDLPFDDETFDHIRANHTIEHLEFPLKALRECYRVLKPNGTMYTEVPNPFHLKNERPEHLYSWSRATLKHIHREAGFHESNIKYGSRCGKYDDDVHHFVNCKKSSSRNSLSSDSSGHFTGTLVVHNQAPTVRLTLKSVHKHLDEIHIIDHGSTDRTALVIQSAVEDFDIEDKTSYSLREFSEPIQDLREELVSSVEEYAVRLEGDQVYFGNSIPDAKKAAEEGVTVTATSYLIRNRFDLSPKSQTQNAPHPFIYHNDGTVKVPDGREQPRSSDHKSRRLEEPVSINCRVNIPQERIRRWHRQSWHHPESRDIPEIKTIPDHPRPYSDYMTLDEYIWELRDIGRGTAEMGWDGGSIRDIGIQFLQWDVENNCRSYDGPYPSDLESHIGKYGVCGVANGLEAISP